ncbi:MAG: helix-turn-helix domain-containing protein [Chloroflexi bacterium]|nr:helix-turn-helix domain-containing protein [Chloroflexota bacterium]
MRTPKADLILHPVRMRVLMALAGRQMTARQIAALLPDVPPATLYRHLNTMTEGGILAVVEENRVRGTVEKVYALASPHAAYLSPADVSGMTKDDYMHLFTTFAVSLLGDFARYLNSRDEIDPVKDNVGFQKLPMHLSDEEMREFGQGLNDLFSRFAANPPAPDRQRRLFSLIFMPDPDPPDSTEQPQQNS